jgi:large subunit ribosomal protein L6
MIQSRNNVVITTLDKYNGLRVKGPLGELRLQLPKGNPTSLINQMIHGVTLGHLVILKIVGIFYKVSKQNGTLYFKLGYSHGIEYTIPANIEITIGMEGGSIVLNIFGINLVEVTKVAAELKKLKPVDRYKGQGIRYLMENPVQVQKTKKK